MRVLLALVLVLGVSAFSIPEGHVLTPFGVRPKACVLEVPSGSRISETETGVKVVSEIDGLIIENHHVPAPECHEDHIIERYNAQRAAQRAGEKDIGSGAINGWLDNAGWYPPTGQNNLDSFISTYTVPGNPTFNSDQVLFYFIGMQDNAYAAVNIIQPVLTWGNGVTGWNLASWDCCPKNITVQSTTLTGFGAGDQITGTIKRANADTWIIDSTIVKSGKNTTLYSEVGDYLYNWADVTLEVYNLATCNQFAVGPMTFSNLILKDQQQQVLTPTWTVTGTTSCNGHEVVNGTMITITHG